MKIDFGNWMPDLPDLSNPGCLEARNVLPRPGGYGQMKNLASFSGALNSVCLGAVWMPDLTGNPVNFAGDSQRLYKYAPATATWADVSRTATYAAAVSWKFEKFGNVCYATDISNELQSFDLATSTTFQNVGGSPPKARYIATVRDFLVLANLSGFPYRVRWSGFNNAELWTSALTTQSDFQDLPGRGGLIQGIVPGEYGTVFQEDSIWVMRYTGPPTVFTFDEVERGRGTPSAGSIVWYGTTVFYWDWSGFMAFTGQGSVPIGSSQVDNWFRANCGDFLSLQGAIDRENQIVMWGFKSRPSSAINDRIVMFHLSAKKWSYAEIETETFVERKAEQLTLDELDTPFPLGIDLQSIPMDSKAFDDDLTIQAFDKNHRAATFEGSAMPAIVTTRELDVDEHWTETTSVAPLVAGGAGVTVRFGSRSRQTESVRYSPYTGLNRVGEACKVVNDRYQRIEVNVSGGFDVATGVDVRARKAGKK